MSKKHFLPAGAVPAKCEVNGLGALEKSAYHGPIGFSATSEWKFQCWSSFKWGPSKGKTGAGLGAKYVLQKDGRWMLTEGDSK